MQELQNTTGNTKGKAVKYKTRIPQNKTFKIKQKKKSTQKLKVKTGKTQSKD